MKCLYFIVGVILLAVIVSAVTWTPQGNIDLKYLYNITNGSYAWFIDVNASANISASAFLGSGAFLTDLVTGDNESWNQSLADELYAPNTTAGIEYLINVTDIWSTFNSTYDADLNNTFNSTYDLWAYNQSTAVFDMYNNNWLSTFNSTYDADLNNTFNSTYDLWAYNQTELSTFNSTYDTWAYNQSTAVFNMYNNVWLSTFNSTYDADLSNTYNSTYDLWAHNETAEALEYCYNKAADIVTNNYNITTNSLFANNVNVSINLTAKDFIIFAPGGYVYDNGTTLILGHS